jgi:hypothetical protein
VPQGLTPLEAQIWKQCKAAVEATRTYQPSDLVFFRLMVKTVAEAESPGDMPPTARARIYQAAGSMLNAFGLSPLARERVKPFEDFRTPGERVLSLVEGGR